MEDLEPIPMASGANLGRCSNLRPPAVVTEFMSQGSVKQALARKSDVVSGNMHRVVVAMDAAKVLLIASKWAVNVYWPYCILVCSMLASRIYCMILVKA